MQVELTPEQARYLSILAAGDLRNGRERRPSGLPEPTVIRDIHQPAWDVLQPACQWEEDN